MDLDLNHLSKDAVAKLLGVTPRSVDLYTKEKEDPLVSHPDPGHFRYYVWAEVLEWRLRREVRRAPAQKFEAKSELDGAKLAGQNLQNEKLQLEIDIHKGHLLEEPDVRKTWADALVSIRQALLNVGHVAATDIVDGMVYSKKKQIVDSLVFQNLGTVIAEVKNAVKAAS